MNCVDLHYKFGGTSMFRKKHTCIVVFGRNNRIMKPSKETTNKSLLFFLLFSSLLLSSNQKLNHTSKQPPSMKLLTCSSITECAKLNTWSRSHQFSHHLIHILPLPNGWISIPVTAYTFIT